MTIEALTALMSLCISVVGLGLIWFQLRQASNSSKASLLISINRDLNSYLEVAVQIEEGVGTDWVARLEAKGKERLLDYVSYFEGLYLAHKRGLFSIAEINDHFAGRFFRLAHDQSVQTNLLLNEAMHGVFQPIFGLHRALHRYRRARRLPDLFPSSQLDMRDPSLYAVMARWPRG